MGKMNFEKCLSLFAIILVTMAIKDTSNGKSAFSDVSIFPPGFLLQKPSNWNISAIDIKSSHQLGKINLGEINLGEIDLGSIMLGEINLGEVITGDVQGLSERKEEIDMRIDNGISLKKIDSSISQIKKQILVILAHNYRTLVSDKALALFEGLAPVLSPNNLHIEMSPPRTACLKHLYSALKKSEEAPLPEISTSNDASAYLEKVMEPMDWALQECRRNAEVLKNEIVCRISVNNADNLIIPSRFNNLQTVLLVHFYIDVLPVVLMSISNVNKLCLLFKK